MAQSRANHVVGFTPSTITICLSDGSFVCGIPQRCDSGLYRAQLDIVLPARDKAPTVRAFLSHIQSKEWGRYLQTGLVCFRGQSQLDWSDPATVLVGGTIDIMSVQEARESALSSWLGHGTGSSNTCGAGRTQVQKDADVERRRQNQEQQLQAAAARTGAATTARDTSLRIAGGSAGSEKYARCWS